MIWVHTVLYPEVFARPAVRCEHYAPEIDEIEVFLRCNVVLDGPVGHHALWRLIPAARPRSNTRIDDSYIRQPGSHHGDERLEIRQQLPGSPPVVEVISPHVQHDEPRVVRKHQAIGKVDQVGKLE